MARLARIEDLKEILGLYKELRPNDPILNYKEAEKAFQNIIDNPNTAVIVEEQNDRLYATCMLGIVPSLAEAARPFGIIEHVVTLAKARGKGFGKSVLSFALQFAWENNCYKVVILSGTQRHEAHRLYESVGFVGGLEKGFVAKPGKI